MALSFTALDRMRGEAHSRIVKSIILKRKVCSFCLHVILRRIMTQRRMQQIRRNPQILQQVWEHQNGLRNERVPEHPLSRWSILHLI